MLCGELTFLVICFEALLLYLIRESNTALVRETHIYVADPV